MEQHHNKEVHEVRSEERAPAVSVSEREGSRELLSLPTAILIASVLISSSLFYVAWNMSKGGAPSMDVRVTPPGAAAPAGEPAPIGGRDVVLGEVNAPVTLLEYGDYQCPFCARFFKDTEPLIKENYVKTGKVRMVYRDFAFLGPESVAASAAAECAKDQGKFWAYHDALYAAEAVDATEHNGNLNRTLFLKLAADVKMDVPAFTECVDSGKYVAEVENQTKAAQASGVNATPTLFLNGQKIQGAQPYATFQSAIDQLLSR